jgi:predicted urease superfamily metal-dependent hydrolase
MQRRNFIKLVGGCLVFGPSVSITQAADEVRVPFTIDLKLSDPNRPTRPEGRRYRGPIFDTHTHLAPTMGQPTFADDVTAGMKDADVQRLVLLPPPNAGRIVGMDKSLEQMESLRQNSQGAIMVMCGSYLTDWMNSAAKQRSVPQDVDSQIARLTRDLQSGRYAGVGEIGFRHYAKAAFQLVINLPQVYPPLLTIAETAGRLNVPLDLHAEPVEPNGTRHDAEVFGTIGLMFERSKNLRLICSHTAMTNANNARALLSAFPMLMMNVNFGKHNSDIDWRNLEAVCDHNGEIYSDWAALFEEMSDRFMIGSDSFFMHSGDRRGRDVVEHYSHRIKQVRKVLGGLNRKATDDIAFKNAERVFGPVRQ